MPNRKTRAIKFEMQDLQRVVDIVPDAAVICEDRGKIFCSNEGARSLLRPSGGELGGEDLASFLPSLEVSTDPGSFVSLVRSGGLDQDLPVICEGGKELEV